MASMNLGADSIKQPEFSTCAICEEPYDDSTHQPKFLSCHHTFCYHCLDELSKSQDNPRVIPCPNCRRDTQLPGNGVDELQRNFYIENMKGTYKTEHKKKNKCPKHDNKLSFFCDTCKKGICRDCTVLDHKETAGHIIMDISDADIFYRQALLQQINRWRDSLMQVKNNVEQLEKEDVLLTAAKETTRKDIEEFIQHVYEKVEERKQQLIEINEQSFSEAHNFLLSMQKTQKEATEMINKNINLSEKLVKNGTLEEVIAINHKHTSPAGVIPLDLVELEYGKTYSALNKSKGEEAFDRSLSHFGEITFKGFLPAKFAFQCEKARVGQNAEIQIKITLWSRKTSPLSHQSFYRRNNWSKGHKNHKCPEYNWP